MSSRCTNFCAAERRARSSVLCTVSLERVDSGKTYVFRTLIESSNDAEAAANLSSLGCRSPSECDTKHVSSAYRKS